MKISPKLVFPIILALTVIWGAYLPSLKFNYNIEAFFSSTDPEVAFYYAHRDTFENENDFVLIGLKNKSGIFHKDFLRKIDSLTKELRKINQIKKVTSPTNLYEFIKTPLGGIKMPIVHLDEPKKYPIDKSRIYTSDLYVNSFFSSDTLSVTILLKKESGLPKQANDRILFAINDVVSKFNFDEFHITGRIKTQQYYIHNMKKQIAIFAVLAITLFLASLHLIFRNIKYVLLSFVTVLISIIWIFGIISWQGISIDLMLTLLPALIFIISTSSSIHMITRFKNEYRINVTKKGAIKKTVEETAMPNFLNAITTAIGFGSLVMIPIYPIQQFGLLVSLGIILSFLINLFLIPTALSVMNIRALNKHEKTIKKSRNLLQFTLSHPVKTISIFALIILISIIYSFKIQINNHFLDDLNPKSSLKKDLDFFDDNFSGIRPFEINIRTKNISTILSREALLELSKIEHYLKTYYKVGFLYSPLTIIKSINKATHGGNIKYYNIPSSEQELKKIINLANKQKLWNRFLPVINKNLTIGRITGKTRDVGGIIFKQRNENLNQFLKKNTHHLQVKITGAAHLMDNTNRQIASNLTKGILLAIIITTLIIGWFTKSWKLALISLLPNLLPLSIVLAIMGITGIPLKVSTSLIFTIVYGIAVDDTIHFLNSYRLNKRLLKENSNVINKTLSVMWQPMLYTSIVLLLGFMIFTISEFSSISLLGYLVSGSMIVALIANLIFLPALLKCLIKT